MSAHYYDAGSGPHDPSSTVNERGERNCGCRHDGQRWLTMCDLALAECQGLHEAAMLEHAARMAAAWIEE